MSEFDSLKRRIDMTLEVINAAFADKANKKHTVAMNEALKFATFAKASVATLERDIAALKVSMDYLREKGVVK